MGLYGMRDRDKDSRCFEIKHILQALSDFIMRIIFSMSAT